jgi:hypothetical protein
MNTRLAALLLTCLAISCSAVDIKEFSKLNDSQKARFALTPRVSKVASDFTFDISVPNDLIYNDEGWSKPLSGVAVVEITPEQMKSGAPLLAAVKRQPIKTERTKLGTTAVGILIAEDKLEISYLEIVYMPPQGGVCPILVYVPITDIKKQQTPSKK